MPNGMENLAASLLTLLVQLWHIFYFIVLPMLLLAGIGWLLQRKMGLDMPTLTRLNFYFVTPGLIYTSVVNSRLEAAAVWSVALFGLAVLAAIGIVTYLVAHPADDMRSRQATPRQRGVKPVCGEVKRPFREPVGYVVHHLLDQLQQRRAAFAVEPDVDRQSQRLPAPRRQDAQAQRHELQAPHVHHMLAGRADGVAAPGRPIHLAARLPVNRVVRQAPQRPRRTQGLDQHGRPRPEHLRRAPRPRAEEPVIRIVAAAALRSGASLRSTRLPLRVGIREDTRHGAPTWAHHLSRDETEDQLAAGLSKDRQTPQENRLQCRYSRHRRSSGKRWMGTSSISTGTASLLEGYLLLKSAKVHLGVATQKSPEIAGN